MPTPRTRARGNVRAAGRAPRPRACRLPPAAEGEEGEDESARERGDERRRRPEPAEERDEVRRVARAREKAPGHEHDEERDLGEGEAVTDRRGEAHPEGVGDGRYGDGGESRGLRGKAGKRLRGVGAEAGGERGGEARIHHEEALPSVEERDRGPEGLPQVDVATRPPPDSARRARRS